MVRGIYSTVTLAVYGQTVDKVNIKIKEIEAPKKEPILSPQSSVSNSPPQTRTIVDSPDLKIEYDAGITIFNNNRV